MLLASACGRGDDGGALSETPAVPLVDSSRQVIGDVRIGDGDEGVTLLVNARGLPPGKHGIHIHEIGLCEPPKFESAGAHWNPTGAKHGARNPSGPHLGDLKTVTVGKDGRLQVEIVVPDAYFRTAARNTRGGARQILDADGAALVIHAKPDDEMSDPSGNSGRRIACAVLGSPQAAPAAAADGNVAATDATEPPAPAY